MRMGKYWSIENIDNGTRIRINKIIDGEYDENIRDDRKLDNKLTIKAKLENG